MFAVKGWAVSADSLKAETEKPTQASPTTDQHQQSGKSKKRKRQSAPVPSNVTDANVADLWHQVIEGKSGKKARTERNSGAASKGEAQKQQKQQRKNGHVKNGVKASGDGGEDDHDDDGEAAAVSKLSRKERKKADKEKAKLEKAGNDDAGEAQSHEPPAKKPKKEKKDKKNKKKQEHPSGPRDDAGEGHEDAADGEQRPQTAEEEVEEPIAAAAPPKLTPLQAAMREKLISARFRHLNETLYTRPSAEAFALFRESPEMFREYHEGFRRQVDVWPENPVDGYVAEIKARGAKKDPHHRSHHKPKHGPSHSQPPDADADADANHDGVQPLPRTGGTCTIADLGCGDAKLAAALGPSLRRLRLAVLSYDLQSDSPRVTRADIADLPRPDASVDVAVFCLALMGTNWPDFVEEAYRVLRWRGELWVAEIKSRFAGSSSSSSSAAKAGAKRPQAGAPVTHSVGFRKKGGGNSNNNNNKKGAHDDAEGDDDPASHAADLAVEVDGAEDRRGATDVTAFVDALRRRGFVLQGEPDLRNRMFVRMRFLKAAPAAVGKCAPKEPVTVGGGGGGGSSGQQGQRRGRPQSLAQRRDAIRKFVGDGGGEGQADERGILKPCVYKIR